MKPHYRLTKSIGLVLAWTLLVFGLVVIPCANTPAFATQPAVVKTAPTKGCNQWVSEAGKWYYFGSNCSLYKGWLKDKGRWYYLDPNTFEMKTGWYEVDGNRYYSYSSGAMATGWIKLGNQWFYLYPSGAQSRDWIKDKNTWYYLDGKTGAMHTGWYQVRGVWYFSYSSGAMATGWLKLGHYWYYLHGSGAMATGWLKQGGVWYYLTNSGEMATGWYQDSGKWYFSNSSGAMVTGWVSSQGKWYYMNSSGEMLTKTWIKPHGKHWYFLDINGVMATGPIYIYPNVEHFDSSGAWYKSTKPSPNEYVNDVETAKEIVELVNAYREQQGVAPLKSNPGIDKVAVDWSLKMYRCDGGCFAHRPSDQQMKLIPPGATATGENILMDSRPYANAHERAVSFFNSWKNSPGHNANMLREIYTDIGVGVVCGKYGGPCYATQNFATYPKK